MYKKLVLGVLLVIALSGQVSSGNHQLISMPKTETVSAAATPVIPTKDIPKAPTAHKTPEFDPSWVAINNMVKAVRLMQDQCKALDKPYVTLENDPRVMGNAGLRSRFVKTKSSNPCFRIRDFLADIQNLQSAWQQANASKTK